MLTAITTSPQPQQDKATIQVRILISNFKDSSFSSVLDCDENDTLVSMEYQFILVFKLDCPTKEVEIHLESIKQLAKNVKFKMNVREGHKTQVSSILTTGAIFYELPRI